MFPSICLPPRPSHKSSTSRPAAASVSPFDLNGSDQSRRRLQLPPPPVKPYNSSSSTHGCTRSSSLQPPTLLPQPPGLPLKKKRTKKQGEEKRLGADMRRRKQNKNHCLLRFLGFAGDVTSLRRCRRGKEEKTTQIHPSLRLCSRRRVEETRRHCS
jgi:hypothetical protein